MNVRLLACLTLQGSLLLAQSTPAPAPQPYDQRSAAQLGDQAEKLLANARKGTTGISGAKLETYPGHYTMLTTRVASGGAEMHKHFNDIFVVLDGEATEVVGGTMLDPKESSPGEFQSAKLDGGERHMLHKGDVVHISPDVPHQMVLAPNQSIVYYVIKVAEPK